MHNKYLREARLIVPVGNITVIDRVRDRLVEEFGGYTETIGRGAYMLASRQFACETIHIFDVAILAGGVGMLQAIAIYVCHAMKQECVYLRHPDGSIEFIGE